MATLLDQTARELLDLFAAGKNTPGAGSAAALMGAVAAALIQSVAKYTRNAAGRKSDLALRDRSAAILEEARRLGERLRAAVDEDAAAFNLFWEQRTSEALQRATEIPIGIAEDCLALAEMGIELRERGFKNARAEANGAALAAAAGAEAALEIVRLNLQAAGTTHWIADCSRTVRRLIARLRELQQRAEPGHP